MKIAGLILIFASGVIAMFDGTPDIIVDGVTLPAPPEVLIEALPD